MENARGAQPAAQRFRILHAGRADENGAAGLVNLANLFFERAVSGMLVRVENVGEVAADHGAVGGDHGDGQHGGGR